MYGWSRWMERSAEATNADIISVGAFTREFYQTMTAEEKNAYMSLT